MILDLLRICKSRININIDTSLMFIYPSKFVDLANEKVVIRDLFLKYQGG